MNGEKSDNTMSKAAQLSDNCICLTIKFEIIFFETTDGIKKWREYVYTQKSTGCC